MSQADMEEVFVDTSVLFNYTFKDDDGSARSLIIRHSCDQCASKNVEKEFNRVRENRQQICNEVIRYIGNDELGDFKPSNYSDLSPNDKDFLENLKDVLSDLDDVTAVKRVNRRLRQLKAGSRDLFSGVRPYIRVISHERVGPGLTGNLRSVVTNEADCRIIHDAADWTYYGGCGRFITSDKDDTLGREGDLQNRSETKSEGGELSDSFLGFIQGDNRSLPEKINDKISSCSDYGNECCLDFYSPPQYLNS